MAHNVSNEYKQVIYSGDARNKLKILFNNVELEDADRYCERMTVKSRIVPNGAKIFSLNNFISKEVELILHDIDTSIIKNQISISIGTLVGNSYEYVPIGIFNIQDTPTNDKRKTTIKLRDNSVKFDFNYNAQELIEANGGSATKLQILQNICSQAGVTCNITSFIGYLDDIGVYDNTITAREYISRIAEQAGKIATINRSGELIFVDLNNLTTWEIPIEIVEKYENGTKFKIGRVVYEDGIVRYETPTSNDDTLFLDGSNNYISGELVKEQASSSGNSYYLDNTGEADLAYFELEGKTTQETRSGKNLFKSDDFNETNHDITFSNINNSLNISGTSTATYYPSVVMYADGSHSILNWVATTSNINAEKGYFNDSGDIIISVFQNGNRTGQQRIVIGYEDNTIDTYYLNSADFATKTYTTNKRINFICIANHPSQTYNVTFKIMISKSGGDYEPYGQMPSPDYPSELVSVGYENLLNITVTSRTLYGITFTINSDGTILANGTATQGFNFYLNSGFALEAGSYVISDNTPNPSDSTYFTFIDGLNIGSRDSNNVKTITTTTNCQARIVIRNGAMLNNVLFKIQLEQSTQAHSYIPYGKYGIEVKTTGKNLFTGLVKGISLSATNGSESISDTSASTDFISVNFENAQKYYLSGLTNTLRSWVGAYNSSKQFLGRIGATGRNNALLSNNDFTSGTPQGTGEIAYLRITQYAYSGGTGVIDDIDNLTIQLEKGNTVTEYEEYKSNTYLYTLDNPLRSIGDTKDLLYIKNGMLYVDRKIGSIVLDGSEEWRDFFSTAGMIVCNIINAISSTSTINCQSNYFKGETRNNIRNGLNNQSIDNCLSASGTELILVNRSITTTNDFKTWLSTHNTEAQYVLATPSLEELGVIEVPKTYEGITYIDISSNINTNTYIQYRESKTQVEAILGETNQFDIDSLKTGKILGNPAIDSYDLIQIHDKSKNLLKNILTTQTINNVSITINNDKTIVANGTASAQIVLTISPTITLSGTYRLSGCPSGGGSSTYELQFYGSGNAVDYGNNNAISTNPNGKVRLVIRKDATLNNLIFAPMLESGSIKTEYVPYKDETYTTLATNDLVYTGVLINTFDTQIGEEAKEQNVFVNGEETFKKWARTTIDNVEGSINLQAGQINEANGRINETNLRIDKDGALLNVIANNSNIDIDYDSAGNPISGEVREVTTTTGFTFNAEGMTIEDTSSNFKALHRNDGTYYKEGDNVVGQYTKDGSKQKDLELFGVYYYGKNDFPDTPMFIAQLYTDENGEECFGHFYNRGD